MRWTMMIYLYISIPSILTPLSSCGICYTHMTKFFVNVLAKVYIRADGGIWRWVQSKPWQECGLVRGWWYSLWWKSLSVMCSWVRKVFRVTKKRNESFTLKQSVSPSTPIPSDSVIMRDGRVSAFLKDVAYEFRKAPDFCSKHPALNAIVTLIQYFFMIILNFFWNREMRSLQYYNRK